MGFASMEAILAQPLTSRARSNPPVSCSRQQGA